MTTLGDKIREQVRSGQCEYSKHAIMRMNQRKIWKNDILNAIMNGAELEVQDRPEFQDIHIVYQEASPYTPEFYVVVAASDPNPVVVTVCNFLEEVWDYLNGIHMRRSGK